MSTAYEQDAKFSIPINPDPHNSVKVYVAELTGSHPTYRFARTWTKSKAHSMTDGSIAIPIPRRSGIYEVQDFDTVTHGKRHRYYQVGFNGDGSLFLDALTCGIAALQRHLDDGLMGRIPGGQVVETYTATTQTVVNNPVVHGVFKVEVPFAEAIRMLREMRQAVIADDYDREDLLMFVETALAALNADEEETDNQEDDDDE
jgi:hypothetical protein